MSWLFGYKTPTTNLPNQNFEGNSTDGSSGHTGNNQTSGGNTNAKNNAGRESIYKFDSTALERAAQAAKELERSRKCDFSECVACNCYIVNCL
jgi:ATPase family AAA domain-containing protein 3A/B